MRRWLLVLPLAVVLALVATASRLQVFWWPDELHDGTTGRQGEPVEVRDRWEDEDGEERVRELEVTVLDVVPATTVESFDGPTEVVAPVGGAVWEVRLGFTLDPEVPLGGCQVSLLDDRGRESSASGGLLPGPDGPGSTVSLPSTSCEPTDSAGPQYDGTRLEDVPARPPSYEVLVYAVTAADAVPARVRVWWEAPDYVEVVLDGS